MAMTAPPADFDRLKTTIAARYGGLSRRLRQVAQFVVKNPNDLALDTISLIAGRAEVQPSTLIRFAKAFGYGGFTEMQRVFRARLVAQAPSYAERIHSLRRRRGRGSLARPLNVLDEFVSTSVASLEHLRQTVPAESLERAIKLLAAAPMIHVVGQRRSFPIAAYLAYGLSQLGRPARLVDGLGGMLAAQTRFIAECDVLLAISFRDYAPEVVDVVHQTRALGAPIVAITDSPLSPLAPASTVCFEVQDVAVDGFRSLAASMCLAQALIIGLGARLEQSAFRRRARRKTTPQKSAAR